MEPPQGAWKIRLDKTAFSLAADAARAGAPQETGGILVGFGSRDGLHVVGMPVVGDPTASGCSYTRWEVTAQATLDQVRSASGHPALGYIGDWHSHPMDAGPSPTDRASLRRAASQFSRPIGLVVLRWRQRQFDPDCLAFFSDVVSVPSVIEPVPFP